MTWADRLEALALTGLAGTPLAGDKTIDRAAFMDGFRDEWGHHRAVDRPLLASLLGIDPGPSPTDASPDVLLWWALHDQSIDPADLVELHGELIARDEETGLEVWTESELAALHALWNLAILRDRSDWTERCFEAASVHLDRLQPDNATNHPWAVHVFMGLADRGSSEAMLYWQGLVSGAQIGLGRPDRFSACLLLDAARRIGK